MSVGFLIDFYNSTGTEVTLTAKVKDMDDWDNKEKDNPDVSIKGVVVHSDTLSPNIHLERHNNRDTAPFTVTADVGGRLLVFELDGCDATNEHDRASIPITVGGSEYTVLQVITKRNEIDNGNPDWNRMSVFLTPYVDPKQWMAKHQDKTLMSVNIPGSHDTGTYGGNGEEGTRCQILNIKEQLDAGVRFLDLRLVLNPKERADDLGIFHGDYFQHVWLKADIVPVVKKFLADNPSECVVFCVNQGSDIHGKPKGDPIDKVLHDILVNGLENNKLFDRNIPEILTWTLKDLKGCVVLLRRDNPQTFGINVSDWPDNTPYYAMPFVGGAGTVELQDAYDVSYGFPGVHQKWWNVKSHLARATAKPIVPTQWYMNWTNASLDPPILPWFPWGYAYGDMSGVNFLLAQHLVLNTAPDACRFGTLVMDYVEEPLNNTLIQLLIAWNRLL